jgi:hypothetical protein
LRKLEALKVRGIQREEKRKRKCFVSWKVYFSSCSFFITPFPLHLKDEF